jgi:hypothetical protein
MRRPRPIKGEGAEDNGVYPVACQRLAHRHAARSDAAMIAAFFEHPADNLGNMVIIVDDKDMLGWSHILCRRGFRS